MTSPDIEPALLAEALEAARRALRRLEDKDIPPRLRDVAGRSGRLPAPLAKRLLKELDASDWLRAEALAEIAPASAESESEGPGSEELGHQSASILFLTRPEGWVDRIEALGSGHRAAVEQSEVKRLETELRKAVAKAGRLEQKLALAERREQEVADGFAGRVTAAAAAQRRSQAKLKSVREELTSKVASTEQEVARLVAENTELRQKLSKARSETPKATTGTKRPPVEAAWSFDKPSALARHLDDINRSLVIAPVKAAKATPTAKPGRLSGLPAGVSPDRAEAIVWLLKLPGMVHVAIDGWNAAHFLKSPPVAATRNKIIEAARRLIRDSSGKRRVTAVFDSSQVGESFSTDDVVVLFVTSADEELVKIAQHNSTGLVVVTSDRMVREAVERAGAVGLWSEALIEWLKTGGRNT